MVITDETASGAITCFVAAPANVGIGAASGATCCVPRKIIVGTDVIIVATGWAISVAFFPWLDYTIPAHGVAVGVGIGIATGGTALVSINALGNFGIRTMSRAIVGRSN